MAGNGELLHMFSADMKPTSWLYGVTHYSVFLPEKMVMFTFVIIRNTIQKQFLVTHGLKFTPDLTVSFLRCQHTCIS